MFKSLYPLLAERSIHILLSQAKDGRIGVYVEPAKLDDKEDHAFVTPFRCEGTPEELDEELSGVLTQWIASRSAVTTSLREALAQAEAQTKADAEEAKRKAAERGKKPAPTASRKVSPQTSTIVKPVTPTLLDGVDDKAGNTARDGETGSCQTPAVQAPPAVKAPAAEAASTPVAEPAQTPPAAATVLASVPVTSELF